MVKTSEYTLVICTCDAYQDTWDPLFQLFRKYWPSLDAPIVLNTETATYKYKGFEIICPQLYKASKSPRSVPWSKRLKETLNEWVNTDLVLLFLEDFFLQSPVDTEKLNICLEKMNADKNIANIQLFSCPMPFWSLPDYPWLVRRSKKAPYLFSLQAGLWRTKRLLHFLRDHESPWYFERWGSIRGRRYRDDFYGLKAINKYEVIFDYDPTKYGMAQGKWRPETGQLFAKEGINVDVSLRGVITKDWHPPLKRRNWIKTIWNIYKSLRP